jgi:hypothetical protein
VFAPSPLEPDPATCIARLMVTVDTPQLRAALAPFAGTYVLEPLFTVVG